VTARVTDAHLGFHAHTAAWVPESDRAFAMRLARYGARKALALERLTYDRAATAVTYRSDSQTAVCMWSPACGRVRMLWRSAAAVGAALVWRAKATTRFPVDERFADGSYRSTLRWNRHGRSTDRTPIPCT